MRAPCFTNVRLPLPLHALKGQRLCELREQWNVCYATNRSGCTGVPDYQEGQKWLLENAQVKKSCARKSALADRALLIRLMLVVGGGE